MGRRRAVGIELPEHVHAVRSGGKVYFYFQRGRGSKSPGPRISLPNDPQSEAFWREYDSLNPKGATKDTVEWLVEEYKQSENFTRLAAQTQEVYSISLRRIVRAWGDLGIAEITPLAATKARDALKETPGMANQLVAVGRILYDWAIPLGMKPGRDQSNPFDKVSPLDLLDRGYIPWPQWVLDYVEQNAWNDLKRMARLGVMTCQRESDLVRMGKKFREGRGLWCRPKKTRRRRRSFLIQLSTADALELDQWSESPIVFTNARFKKPWSHYREDLYLYTPRGVPYNETSLRSRWIRWLKRTGAGKRLCKLWREWVETQVEKYDWDFEPEDATWPHIHGLRATGVLKRLGEGHSVERISNDVGMDPNTIERYMRFRDQVKVGEALRTKLSVVKE